jgi:two-component system, LytTR family, sensor kinase
MVAGERHPNADERQHRELFFDVHDSLGLSSDSPGHARWWLVTGSIVVLLWGGYFAGTSALLDLGSSRPTGYLYLPRAIVDLAGVLISFGIMGVLYRLRDSSLVRRAIIAVVMAIAASALQSVINTKVFNIYFPGTSPGFGLRDFAIDYAWRIWIWFSTSGTILAMSYALDIRERERRILALQALAHSAQLRALRFQLNPHFLFNALNSIAGLISAKRVNEAETMTENLSDFLRLTLALDPQGLITLDEELQLQSLYLEIEKKRFPDRLTVSVDVPRDVRDALVPSLITQPLIENSVKYAIARSTRPVELAISARQFDGQLELIVADRGGDAEAAPNKGAHLGLRNVAERISTYYGDRGRLSAEPLDGGFQNRILVPLELRA